MNSKFLVLVLLLALATMSPAATVIDTPPELPLEPYTVRLSGFFVQNINTTIRVDAHGSSGGQEWNRGTTIDLDEMLNVETSVNVFRAEFTALLARKHRIDVAWFDMKETGRTVLGENIDWGGTVFPQGITVDSFIRTNILRIDYTYLIVQKPRWQLGLSIGAHVMKIGTGISAVGTAQSASEGVTAPLPVLGISVDYAITSKLILRGHGEYLSLRYGDYSGRLEDIYGALEWRVTPTISMGGGGEYFDISLTTTKSSSKWETRQRWTGYQAYLAFSF